MQRICILTDSTAQFTRPNFPGRERVFMIQMGTGTEDGETGDGQLQPPSTQDYIRYFAHLSREYDAVLVLTLSARLNAAAHNAEKASLQYTNHASIQVVDSLSTSAGLGMLVELAADACLTGGSITEVEQLVRAALSRIYMLLCIPDLNRLVGLGLLSATQAVVGEMLGMMPVFMVEDGGLTPLEKVRTHRHLFETFEEFMAEFTAPRQVALLRGTSQTTLRTRPLRQFVQESFPGTMYSEHALNPSLACLFGAQCIGLIVMDPV